jgi:hypothetical protein
MPQCGEITVTDERSLGELTRAEALQLLASVPVGRLVFTHQALPAIRPVNHLVEGDKVVIGLTAGSAIAASSGPGATVVAYEAEPDHYHGPSGSLGEVEGDRNRLPAYPGSAIRRDRPGRPVAVRAISSPPA